MNQEVSILDPATAPGKLTFRLAPVANFCPSPPACGGEGEISGARLLANFVHIQPRGFWGSFQDEQSNGYRRAAQPVGTNDTQTLEAVSDPGHRHDGAGVPGGRRTQRRHIGCDALYRVAFLHRRRFPRCLGVALAADAGFCVVDADRSAVGCARPDTDPSAAGRRAELDDGAGCVLHRRGHRLDHRRDRASPASAQLGLGAV